MKKLLDSDWLRAVQLKSNTSAQGATPVQIKNKNSWIWSSVHRWQRLNIIKKIHKPPITFEKFSRLRTEYSWVFQKALWAR